LLLAKQIITLYHAAQKPITKDQHALSISSKMLSDTLWLLILPISDIFPHQWFKSSNLSL
ncbi:hypothetical protein J5X92_08230, partial [Alteromonas sp. K632G]|uniref:hypothetical protein n=1 Tax=Alteromonas sp. K632G TaxID=2820757 RepID=UPI001AD70BB2